MKKISQNDLSSRHKRWLKARQYTPEQLETARLILKEIQEGAPTLEAIRRRPLSRGGYTAKHTLVAVYRQMVNSGELESSPQLLARIRMKPKRTLSGVTTVTVLTKPYACPGECIFCPDDKELPKSYLREEPGAARAFQNQFDPFKQVNSRIESYQAIGHPTDKIELLILGGSWTAYPHNYQDWFIKRCLDAMNGSTSETLVQAQSLNESTKHRDVGLVIETRPDEITPKVLFNLRKQGVTKVQIGAQNFNDHILSLNKRGHTSKDTLRATALLRSAGFKIVMHWMPNLLGATLESDRQDFHHMFDDGYCPDEIKIYPTQLLESADLYSYWQKGKYKPYTTDELIHLIADLKPHIPPYCRVNRIIRDIPATHIVAGNRRSSLRQDIQKELTRRGEICSCVRCREILGQTVNLNDLKLEDLVYQAAFAEEHFLSFVTHANKLAGYLRLSLPDPKLDADMQPDFHRIFSSMPELKDATIIREVHIYGQSLEVSSEQAGAAQHSGLGTALLEKATEIARAHKSQKLTVIAAIGTRLYYESRGFKRGDLYMSQVLN
jgi:elongator complex protein 3